MYSRRVVHLDKRSVQGGANGYVFVPFQAMRLPTNPVTLSRSMCSRVVGGWGYISKPFHVFDVGDS